MKNIKRRDFLKTGLITGITVSPMAKAIAATSEENIHNHPASRKKIIVGGAGITGLCCAYELMKAGHDVTVLEANGRHGGHIFTGRDGLSDELYADYGADHITRPGYERFFEYVDEFKLKAIPYPNAEGSQAAFDKHALRMIDGKFYSYEQLSQPDTLTALGFNEKETKFLQRDQLYALDYFFLEPYLKNFDHKQPLASATAALDNIPVSDLYKKLGASPTALRFLGGEYVSALFQLWRMSGSKARGIPPSQGDTFHLKGGNQQLPDAFAKKLGARVLLKHPIRSIAQTETGVTVTYKAFDYDEEKQITADFFVNCIPLPLFKKIPVSPALSAEKQYVVNNLRYSSHPFFVFEAASEFWLEDGLKSINMEFEHPDISSIWKETNEVDTGRIILKAYGPGGVSPQRVLAAFRKLYPGRHDTIVQALTFDWTTDKFAPTCEMEPFPIGEMHRFWPQILQPEGRIYFAGTYADELSRGMESCIRSAQRVAKEISGLA